MQKPRLSSRTAWILSTGFFFLIVMTLLRLAMYFWFNRHGLSLEGVSQSFLLGLRFDLRAVSIVMLAMLLFTSISSCNPLNRPGARQPWMIVLTLLSFLFIVFYIADFAHYSYLSQRLNASVLNYLEDAAISMTMVWESYPVIRIILGIAIGTLLFWYILKKILSYHIRRQGQTSGKYKIVEFVILFLLTGLLVFGNLSQYPLRWSDAFGLGTDYKANLALNPFESFFNTLQFRKRAYSPERLKELYPFLDNYYAFEETQGEMHFTRKVVAREIYNSEPNVVLVIAESFSAYKSSFFGNPLNTTPFFDSLCMNGILFDRCFTPAYGTARGVWATITGSPDVESPATASRNPAAVDQHTIINAYTNHEKFFFLGGSTSWANMRGLLNNNIQELKLYEQDNFEAPKIDVWGISDKNLFLEANRILAANKKPFFAIIQTADNHRPYTIPEEDLDEFKKINLPLDTLRKYSFESVAEFNAFRYTDFCFRKFMEAASGEDYFDNTIFVFIGDHGIPGNASNLFPKVWTDQRLTQHHVPLLYYAPRFIKPQRNHRVSSQIDVLPTLAGLSRVSYVNTTLGRDLLSAEIKKDFAFIFDLDNRQIGIIDSLYFFRKMINTDKEEVFSMTSNQPAAITEEQKKELRLLSEAFYEASRYLLLNNKKEYVK